MFLFGIVIYFLLLFNRKASQPANKYFYRYKLIKFKRINIIIVVTLFNLLRTISITNTK